MDNTRKGFKLTPTDKDKRIEELEEKISNLLSCKNCSENKGGFICVKEYENKCLAQKIQYIKELKEEIENLKKTYCKQRNKRIDDLQKENAELKQENKVLAQNLEDTEILNKAYEKRFNDLEKENAELKKQLEMSNKVYNDNLDYSHHIEEQLTNAKEIIKTFLGFAETFGYSPSMDKFISDTEQFLNSEVEK